MQPIFKAGFNTVAKVGVVDEIEAELSVPMLKLEGVPARAGLQTGDHSPRIIRRKTCPCHGPREQNCCLRRELRLRIRAGCAADAAVFFNITFKRGHRPRWPSCPSCSRSTRSSVPGTIEKCLTARITKEGCRFGLWRTLDKEMLPFERNHSHPRRRLVIRPQREPSPSRTLFRDSSLHCWFLVES